MTLPLIILTLVLAGCSPKPCEHLPRDWKISYTVVMSNPMYQYATFTCKCKHFWKTSDPLPLEGEKFTKDQRLTVNKIHREIERISRSVRWHLPKELK